MNIPKDEFMKKERLPKIEKAEPKTLTEQIRKRVKECAKIHASEIERRFMAFPIRVPTELVLKIIDEEFEGLIEELKKRKIQRDANNEHGSTYPCPACERNEELDWFLGLLGCPKQGDRKTCAPVNCSSSAENSVTLGKSPKKEKQKP